MPQASERSLATPMMSPCLPAIRPMLVPFRPHLRRSYTMRPARARKAGGSACAGADVAAVDAADVVEEGAGGRRVGHALAGGMAGQPSHRGGQLGEPY